MGLDLPPHRPSAARDISWMARISQAQRTLHRHGHAWRRPVLVTPINAQAKVWHSTGMGVSRQDHTINPNLGHSFSISLAHPTHKVYMLPGRILKVPSSARIFDRNHVHKYPPVHGQNSPNKYGKTHPHNLILAHLPSSAPHTFLLSVVLLHFFTLKSNPAQAEWSTTHPHPTNHIDSGRGPILRSRAAADSKSMMKRVRMAPKGQPPSGASAPKLRFSQTCRRRWN